MDDIAAAARLTKRTLYNHFESKDQLLAHVLEAQHHLALEAFRTFGDRLSGTTEAIVREMFRDLAVGSTHRAGQVLALLGSSSNLPIYQGIPRD